MVKHIKNGLYFFLLTIKRFLGVVACIDGDNNNSALCFCHAFSLHQLAALKLYAIVNTYVVHLLWTNRGTPKPSVKRGRKRDTFHARLTLPKFPGVLGWQTSCQLVFNSWTRILQSGRYRWLAIHVLFLISGLKRQINRGMGRQGCLGTAKLGSSFPGSHFVPRRSWSRG